MADVRFERKKTLSRTDAAKWLSALSKSFSQGGEVELPFGNDSIVSLELPDDVRAEFEVEVKGDTVEIEVEFSWSLAKAPAEGGSTPRSKPRTARPRPRST